MFLNFCSETYATTPTLTLKPQTLNNVNTHTVTERRIYSGFPRQKQSTTHLSSRK